MVGYGVVLGFCKVLKVKKDVFFRIGGILTWKSRSRKLVNFLFFLLCEFDFWLFSLGFFGFIRLEIYFK